ncbi:carboxypeptidase-like regulatory domain-containing protein [Siansivirga zeaxanthinifaciens]|uniref:Membrane protein n=1 Tax=Siansivirga zeaxanthinifaciens CC-SAMT-1 TaxID=1454006 RepID=A0A0C5WEJ5_9FLAO|nr:carboxypeptidase-like regulatory domain-containing protein [Siansivirga zeaxanthinifaciens]AJR03629.1 membrane protein [Siansivirga zeaxanthinifaciens CC-SAMT-1]
MRYFVTITFAFLCSNLLWTQSIERHDLEGQVFASSNDVEGVTIFNTSTNKGTITNEKGEFRIFAAENDILEISALQFQPQKITITKDVLKLKTLKLFLVEHVNSLDAVFLMFGLTGNINQDIENAGNAPVIQLNLGNLDNLEFFDDRSLDNRVVANALNSITNKGGLYNGVNFVSLFKGLLKSKKNKKSKTNNEKVPFTQHKTLTDIYTHKYISETFNMPLGQVEAFVAYVENKGIPENLYSEEQAFNRIDYLVKQRDLFLSLPNVKN